jgi:hypothetical protein
MTTTTVNNDLASLYEYLTEVKPFHTKIRDVTVKYLCEDSFNVFCEDSSLIYAHATSTHNSKFIAPAEFGSRQEMPGIFSGISDGTDSFKIWKIPDPQFGISSLLYDHKQPIINSDEFVAPVYLPFNMISAALNSITRYADMETGVYANTYALVVNSTIKFESTKNLSEYDNLCLYFKTAVISSSKYSVSIIKNSDGTFNKSIVTLTDSRTVYVDVSRFREYIQSSFLGDVTSAKPALNVSDSSIQTLVKNIILSEKKIYTLIDGTLNPFKYTEYAVRSTPSHQIGVIDEIELSVDDDVDQEITILNSTLEVDNIGHIEIVKEGFDVTSFDEAGFDSNSFVPITAFNSSILHVSYVVTYTFNDSISPNTQFFVDGAMIARCDSSGNLVKISSEYNFSSTGATCQKTKSVNVDESVFTYDELLLFYDFDTRTIKNKKALYSILVESVLSKMNKMTIYAVDTGSYKIMYHDSLKVYVNGYLKEENTDYTVNYPLGDTITFNDDKRPAVYDQLTFDHYVFGNLSVLIDGIEMPLYYDKKSLSLVQDRFGWVDILSVENYIDQSSTVDYSIYGTTILNSVDVYVYDYDIINGNMVIDESKKTLYGYLRRNADTAGLIYFTFEFANTPPAGSVIAIEIRQNTVYGNIANTVVADSVRLTAHAKNQDACTADIDDRLYINKCLYATIIAEIVSDTAVTKMILSHSYSDRLNRKILEVYNAAGNKITTGYSIVTENNKLKITFNTADKYKVVLHD